MKPGRKPTKLNEEKVREIKRQIKEGICQSKIAREFGVYPSHITGIKNGTLWREVEDQ